MKITELNDLCENFKIQNNFVVVFTAFDVNLRYLERIIAEYQLFRSKAREANDRASERYWSGIISGLEEAIRTIIAIKNCVIIPKPKEELENE